MAGSEFSWVYLIFLLIPLARVLPRLIKKWKTKNLRDDQSQNKWSTTPSGAPIDSQKELFQSPFRQGSRSRSLDMQVLGELNSGTKNFEALQKHLNIDNDTLNSILENLESQGLMRVEQKQGILGPKINLYPTDEGFRKYYS